MMFSFNFLFGSNDECWDHSHEVSKYIQGYYTNNEYSLKILYRNLLFQILESVITGNTVKFNENISFLDLISRSEKDDTLKRFFEDSNTSLKKSNLIIMCCKHNRVEILNIVLNNEYNILDNLTFKIGNNLLKPNDVDEESHNAFYYAIRTSNVDIIELLVEKWPYENINKNSELLDNILSSAYSELKLRFVKVCYKMELWIYKKLLDLRFFDIPEDNKGISNNDLSNHFTKIITRIESVNEAFTELQKYQIPEKQHNIFLFILKFISRNIHILKRLLKCTYDKLPWEEIEFCLVSYIWSYTKVNSELGLFYRCLFTKIKIVNYLKTFLENLLEILDDIKSIEENKLNVLPNCSRSDVKKIISANVEQFNELYENYLLARDMRSLGIINHYLELACTVDTNTVEGKLIITRTLQIIGEHLKNSLESPKFSEKMTEQLTQALNRERSVHSMSLLKEAKKMIVELRNALSHYNTLVGSQTEHSSAKDLFCDLQKDIKKLTTIFSYNYHQNKMLLLRTIIVRNVLLPTSEENKSLENLFQNAETHESILEDIRTEEIDKINQITEEFEMAVSKSKNEALTLHFQFLKKIIKCEKDRLLIVSEVSETNFLYLKKVMSNPMKFTCNVLNTISLEGIFKMPDSHVGLLNNYDVILKLSANIVHSLKSISKGNNNYDEPIYKFISGIYTNVVYKVNDVECIKNLWGQLQVSTKNRRKPPKNKQSPPNFMTKLVNLQTLLKNLNDAVTNMDQRYYQASMEMLILDTLSTLKDSLKIVSENTYFLDTDVPILNGNSLRQHLAHINDIFETLDCDSSVAVFLNFQKLLVEDIKSSNRIIGKTINNCPSDLIEKFRHRISVLINQNNIYESITDGNIEKLKSLIQNGGDIHSEIDHNLSSCLHVAADSGRADMFKFLLEQNLSIHMKDKEGQTAFHVAAKAGRKNIVELCLALGSEVDETDNSGRTPLHLAAESGHHTIVDILLNYRPDVDKACNCGFSALTYALQNNHLKIVQHLLSRKSRLTTEEINRETFVAIENGRDEALEFLISCGANLNNRRLSDNITPLMFAVSIGQIKIIHRLLDSGAQVNMGDEENFTPLHMGICHDHEEIVFLLLNRGANVLSSSNEGITPIHLASGTGNQKILNKLIEMGANVNAKTSRGITSLHLAAFHGRLNAVQLLLEKGSKIGSSMLLARYTPFDLSIIYGHTEVVSFLMEHGAGFVPDSSSGRKPLFLAADAGHLKVIDLLISKGFDINETDSYGKTILHHSVISGNYELTSFLIDKNAAINIRDNDGRSPVHHASFLGDVETVKLLLKFGGEVNENNQEFYSPLHYAICSRDKDMVSYLISNKADIHALGEDGKTPLYIAVGSSSIEIINILLKSGADVNLFSKGKPSLIDNAIMNNRKDVLNILLNNGAKLDTCNKSLILAVQCAGSYDFVNTLLKRKAITSFQDENGDTALHWAARLNKVEISLCLLKNGADVNITNNNGCKAIHLAAQEGNASIIQMLLKAGSLVNSVNDKCLTPLHLAAIKGNKESISVLINRQADKSLRSNEGYIPLHLAALDGHDDILILLIDRKNINTEDNAGKTPLYMASVKGHKMVVETLLRRGARVNVSEQCVKGKEYERSPLQAAVIFGYKEIVKLLLEKGACVNLRDTRNTTSLHEASRKNYGELAQMLLDFGADIDCSDENNSTPLHIACFYEYENLVARLLRGGARTNCQNQEGLTPLHIAVLKENTNLTKILLDHNSDLNLCNVDNLIPFDLALLGGQKEIIEQFLIRMDKKVNYSLHISALKGHLNVVEMLIDCGYDVNQKSKCFYKEINDTSKHNSLINSQHCRTPLHFAVFGGHESIVELLINNKSDVNCIDEEGNTPLHIAAQEGLEYILNLLISNGANVNCRTKSLETPLHYSACNGHGTITEILIEKGCYLESRLNDGYTPLQLAVEYGKIETSKILIGNGANLETQDNIGRRPIHQAALKGHSELLSLLIQKGAELNCKDNCGKTPLRLACVAGNFASVKHLLDGNAKINEKCNKGHSALHFASYLGHDKIVQLLIENNAEVDCVDKEGTTPLYMSVQENRLSIVSFLLKNGASVNKTDIYSVTPLHIAAFKGHLNIVAILMQNGANQNVVNDENETPLDLANNEGHDDIVKLLTRTHA